MLFCEIFVMKRKYASKKTTEVYVEIIRINLLKGVI